MKIDLSGKLAVISGSSTGIGLAIAEGLAKAGASVTITGRKENQLFEAVELIQSSAPQVEVKSVTADLATLEGVEILTQSTPETDILINNLGIYDFKSFGEYTDEEWEKYFQVNIMTGVRLTRYYLPKMLEKNWGRIVFISSESALKVPPDMIPYAMTKTAQLTIARGLAESVAGTGITVNSVMPGPTRSQGLIERFQKRAEQEGKTLEEIEREFMAKERPDSLIKRLLNPEEIASLVTYLCSEQSSGTTGAPLRVEGGLINTIA
ncbi:MAG: SDR family oxidoreductase [Lyngbya sp.]|nr:SDR family oxidoreductase [Lyngbya sp.]